MDYQSGLFLLIFLLNLFYRKAITEFMKCMVKLKDILSELLSKALGFSRVRLLEFWVYGVQLLSDLPWAWIDFRRTQTFGPIYTNHIYYNKKMFITKKKKKKKKNCCNNIEVIAIVYAKCCNKIWGNKFVLQKFCCNKP